MFTAVQHKVFISAAPFHVNSHTAQLFCLETKVQSWYSLKYSYLFEEWQTLEMSMRLAMNVFYT